MPDSAPEQHLPQRPVITLLSEPQVFMGHRDGLYALCAVPGTTTFFSAGADGLVVLWNWQTGDDGHPILRLDAPVYSLWHGEIAQRPVLVVGQNDGGLRYLDLETRTEIKAVQVHRSAVFALASDPATGLLWSAGGDGSLCSWHLNGQTLHCHTQHPLSTAAIRKVAVFGAWLAAVGSDGQLRILETATGRVLAQAAAHTPSVFSVCAQHSPDDGWVLHTAGRDAGLKRWHWQPEPQTLACTHSVAAHHFAINHVLHHAETGTLVTVSKDKTIKLWNPRTLQLWKVLDARRTACHTASINYAQSLGAAGMITCSDDRTIRRFAWHLA
jgi:WD40 repeat protein